jgi:PTS system mannose-specific IID component
LIWAGWLPFCSLLALAAFGLRATPLTVLLIFLVTYNVGHLGLRVWGLRVGWRNGMRVASALANPVLRQGPGYIARAAALLGGVALPLALERIIESGRAFLGAVLLVTIVGATLLTRVHGRVEGWKLALGGLALCALYSAVAR